MSDVPPLIREYADRARNLAAAIRNIQRSAIELTLPIRTVNDSNGKHGHWATKAKRRKAQRAVVALAFGTKLTRFRDVPCRVTLTRIQAGNRPMDFDGLVCSQKALRDALAELLGRDDADRSIRWEYAQERGKAHGVRVRVEEWEAE